MSCAEVDEQVAERAAAYTSKLQRYFVRPRILIRIPELRARGIVHMDQILINDYFRFFEHNKTLPRSLSHLVDNHGEPYADPPPSSDDNDDDAAAAAADGDGGSDGPSDDDRPGPGSSVRYVVRDEAEFPQEKHYVWRRYRRRVTRLPAFSPVHGERYFLRLLLLNVAARSFEELRTVGDTVHPNFSSAANKRGLVPQGDEGRISMLSVASAITGDPATSTPASLRRLFCMYCVHNRDAIRPEESFDEFWKTMSLDFSRPGWRHGEGDSREGLTDNLLRVLVARELHRLLFNQGRALVEFVPSVAQFEEALTVEERALLRPPPRLVVEHRLAMTQDQALALYSRNYGRATRSQRVIVDYWVGERNAGRVPQIFIDALAGRGKTYVMSESVAQLCTDTKYTTRISHVDIIGAWERSRGYLPVFGAYTGIVALLHVLGMTDHRLFGLPVDNDESAPGISKIRPSDALGELLAAATMIGLDEVLMHKYVVQ